MNTRVLILRSIGESEDEYFEGKTIRQQNCNYDLNYINAFELPDIFIKECRKIEFDYKSWFKRNFPNEKMLDDRMMKEIVESLKRYREGLTTKLQLDNFVAHLISPNATKLNKRLAIRIRNFQPQILIAHSGLVFQRFPGEFIDSLILAKKNDPSLRFGFDGGIPKIGKIFDKKNINRHEYNTIFLEDFFEESKEMNALIELTL
jgi:hypothetical protein